ncbi:MAG: SDR family oxidoreductase [Gammaproteobacteria bacterium]|nr:SDR family oxidoreductase [Gammaproteobacteria bacterium]MCY4219519.1 SDR family oxidoreductase [Gammaproteobacteria bacterium]MCY4275305.1 SDR family oxidoreductase [Gammaproteobacteria bacterium]
MKQFSLEGKIFIVTGASSGIGKATSRYLALAGATVLCIARRQDPLDELVAKINDEGGEASRLIADLSVLEDLPDIANTCKNIYKPIHGLVNAAGVNLREDVDKITIESWHATLNINLATPFFFSREFIPNMKETGYGRIVNFASLQSVRAFPNGLAYGSSKGGVCQLTRAMAEAWSSHGITCNAIAPGFFPTELTEPVFSDSTIRQWAADQTLIGRNGEMEDLAGTLIFLASRASQYITGQVLFVDGGFTAK